MRDLIDVAAKLQAFCEQRKWRFCFIGGLAVQHLAEARLTKDTDLTLVTGFGGEELFIDELLKAYRPRRPDARQFALVNRVLLLFAENGSGIDIALGALPFEEEAVNRATYVEYADGMALRICSAEDLIIMKAFAGRDQDWNDVRMTIVRQGVDAIDWGHIEKYLTELATLKEEPEILDRLWALRKKYSTAG
jgi:hypothetical protein